MELEIEYVNENLEDQMKQMEVKVESQKQAYFKRQMELKDQCNSLQDQIINSTEANAKKIDFLQDMCHTQDANIRHVEYYLNKVTPAKQFS
jgi:hypothetical protein